jgi:hypothetical protein
MKLFHFLKNNFKPGDPLWAHGSASWKNRVANVLQDCEMIGGHIEKPAHLDGKAWKWVVDTQSIMAEVLQQFAGGAMRFGGTPYAPSALDWELVETDELIHETNYAIVDVDTVHHVITVREDGLYSLKLSGRISIPATDDGSLNALSLAIWVNSAAPSWVEVLNLGYQLVFDPELSESYSTVALCEATLSIDEVLSANDELAIYALGQGDTPPTLARCRLDVRYAGPATTGITTTT